MASNFILYSSNHLDELSIKLVEVLATPLPNPFASETVIVQNRGMGTYLQQKISQDLGIAANIEYPFVNKVVEDIMKFALPAHITKDLEFFQPSAMRFALYNELMNLDEREEFEPYRQYISAGRKEERARQLSAVLAGLFDQYQIYRPEMILQGGPTMPAQRELWRKISYNRYSRTKVFEEFFKLKKAPELKDKWNRLSLFGISNMPPLFLWTFQKLAEFIPVHFFYQNPCRIEWSFAIAPSEEKRPIERLENFDDDFLVNPDAFSTEFNALLASYGRLGREFFSSILEYTNYGFDDDNSSFINPLDQRETLLAMIQQDILDGENRTNNPLIDNDDDSLKIVNCHHALREIEILHNALLNYFDQNKTLNAGDIIVMVPDIEEYVPYIKAVFESIPTESPRYIPFSLGDRSTDFDRAVYDSFFAIYKTLSGRCRSNEVLDLLDCEAIRDKFDISNNELELLRFLIADNATAWGIDAEHRRELLGGKGIDFNYNTWRETRDRLLLGYAMRQVDEENPRLFKGKVPSRYIEGDVAVLIGKFDSFLNLLFPLHKDFCSFNTTEFFRNFLNVLLDNFFDSSGESFRAIQTVRNTINSVCDNAVIANFDNHVSVELILAEIERSLTEIRSTGGFLRGGVTFCTLQPMRNIPHKIIALLGMNENTYPRRSQQSGLDLIWKHPRRGDRSPRLEDRYLFLEALLSAKEKLYLSYVGQSISDNEPIPPSTLVSELLNYINKHFRFVDNNYYQIHPLQGFNPVYFEEDSHLKSYSLEHYITACKLQKARHNPPENRKFITEPIVIDATKQESIYSATTLHNFFRNPFQFFCSNVLGMSTMLFAQDETLNHEPTSLDSLTSYDLRSRLLKGRLSNIADNEVLDFYRASGLMPAPPLDEVDSCRIINEVDTITTASVEELDGLSVQKIFELGASVPPELNFSQSTICCKYKNTIVYITPSRIDGRAAVIGRIAQLTAGMMHISDKETFDSVPRIVIIGRDKQLTFDSLVTGQIKKQYQRLLELYDEGTTSPIPFMPKTSWKLFTGHSILADWNGNSYQGIAGDKDNFAVKLFAPADLPNSSDLEKWTKYAKMFFSEELDNE